MSRSSRWEVAKARPAILRSTACACARSGSDAAARTSRSAEIAKAAGVPTPALLRRRAQRLFGWIIEGELKVRIGGIYPLADAARAHADMEARTTTGKLLLEP